MERNNNDNNCYLTPGDIVRRSSNDTHAREHSAYLTPISVPREGSGGSALMGVDSYLTPVLTTGGSNVSEGYLTRKNQSQTEEANVDNIRSALFNSNNVINVVDKQPRRMPTNANHEPSGETDFFDDCDDDDDMCPFDVEHSSKDAYEDLQGNDHQYTALKPDRSYENRRESPACKDDHTDEAEQVNGTGTNDFSEEIPADTDHSKIYHTINEKRVRRYIELEGEASSPYSVESNEQNNASELQYIAFEGEAIQQLRSSSRQLENTGSVVALQTSWWWQNRMTIFCYTLIAVISLCIAVVVTMTQVKHKGTTVDIVETAMASESPFITQSILTSAETNVSETWTRSTVLNSGDISVKATGITSAPGKDNRNCSLSFLVPISTWDIGIRIATGERANVTISAPGVSLEKSITTNLTTYSSVKLPDSKGIERKGIQIYAITADISVICCMQNASNYNWLPTEDVFLVLPEEMISTRYFIASHRYTRGSNRFVILSTASNTYISITFKLPNGGTATATKPHGHFYHTGSQLNISLNKLDTLNIESMDDLTGTAIRSNKKIAVFVGAVCTSIPVDVHSCGPLAEQMLPVDAWSKSYIVSPVFEIISYVRILAAVDATVIKMNYGGRTISKTLNSGDFFAHRLRRPLVVISDHPVSIVIYGSENYGSPIGGPFLAVVPGLDKFLRRYTFFCFQTFQCYATIIIKFEHKEGLLLDNESVNATWERDMALFYTTMVIAVSGGSHTVKHSSNNVEFGVLVYGIKEYYSFGYAAGYALKRNVPESE